MIIVALVGNLGNTMFCYALYRQLQEMGREALLDYKSWEKDTGNIEKIRFQLEDFNVNIKISSKKQNNTLAILGKSFYKRVFRKIFGNKSTYIQEKNLFCFDTDILALENVYLKGFWQTEKYFKSIRYKLLDEFKLKNSIDSANEEMLETIKNTNAVFVHVRRGDIVENKKWVGNVCSERYYFSAIEYIEKMVEDPVFFVFSNDMKWCHAVFSKKDNFIFVNINNADKGAFDINLMRYCSHGIISISTFSWWGAWLIENPDRITVAPDRWWNGSKSTDIEFDGWVRIDNEGKVLSR